MRRFSAIEFVVRSRGKSCLCRFLSPSFTLRRIFFFRKMIKLCPKNLVRQLYHLFDVSFQRLIKGILYWTFFNHLLQRMMCCNVVFEKPLMAVSAVDDFTASTDLTGSSYKVEIANVRTSHNRLPNHYNISAFTKTIKATLRYFFVKWYGWTTNHKLPESDRSTQLTPTTDFHLTLPVSDSLSVVLNWTPQMIFFVVATCQRTMYEVWISF